MLEGESRRSWAVYAITKHGMGIGKRLADQLPGAHFYVSNKLREQAPTGTLGFDLPMGPLLQETFKAYDCHIFIVSVGAMVRMIAPLMENKKVDPAILCVDDNAAFVIPILSGHVGRGNEFARRVAALLNAQAVITTASDVRGTLTVDILGRELGWVLDDLDRNVTHGCAAVVNQEPVLIVQETGECDFWPLNQSFPPGVQYTTTLKGVDPSRYAMILLITDRDIQKDYPDIYAHAVIYRPKSLILGLGCDSQTPLELIERGILKVFKDHKLDVRCVRAFASVDKKAQEPAFLQLKEKYGWEFKTFRSEDLDALKDIPNPSETVMRFMGIRGVAEPSALLAAGAEDLLVPKQIYKEPEIPRSMTVAVARIPFPSRQREAQLVG